MENLAIDKRGARKLARQSLQAAGFTGSGRWLVVQAGDVATFEAKARIDGKIQLFMLRDGRRFVGTVAPEALILAMNVALKGAR